MKDLEDYGNDYYNIIKEIENQIQQEEIDRKSILDNLNKLIAAVESYAYHSAIAYQ